VSKILIKNSQPFGKKCQKTAGEGFFLTHTVHVNVTKSVQSVSTNTETYRFMVYSHKMMLGLS